MLIRELEVTATFGGGAETVNLTGAPAQSLAFALMGLNGLTLPRAISYFDENGEFQSKTYCCGDTWTQTVTATDVPEEPCDPLTC